MNDTLQMWEPGLSNIPGNLKAEILVLKEPVTTNGGTYQYFWNDLFPSPGSGVFDVVLPNLYRRPASGSLVCQCFG